MTYETHGLTIELVQGDITNQPDLDAVVNAANAQLRSGGGVAGAIHRAAGPALTEETRAMAPIQPGEAVSSDGHNLPNAYIIHVLGPVYGRDEPSGELLRAGYANALDLAEQHEITSIGFPALSTGAFGFPMEPAANIALQTVLDHARDLRHLSLVRFVLFDETALDVHEAQLRNLVHG